MTHRLSSSYKKVNLIQRLESKLIGDYGVRHELCDSTYQKVPVVERLDFELWSYKVKIISKYSPKVDFESSHILESSVLTLWKELEGFDIKMVFSCKNGLLNYLVQQCFCRDSQSLIPQNQLSRTQYQNSNIFAPKLSWKNSYLENSKKAIFNFWPNMYLSICWVKFDKSKDVTIMNLWYNLTWKFQT